MKCHVPYLIVLLGVTSISIMEVAAIAQDNIFFGKLPLPTTTTTTTTPRRTIRRTTPASTPIARLSFLYPGETEKPSSTPTSVESSTTKCPNESYGECIGRCDVDSDYNPICASDGNVYRNPGNLACAQNCGNPATFSHYGNCVTESPVAVPVSDCRAMLDYQRCFRRCPPVMVVNPVCATDGITYIDLATLVCAQRCGNTAGFVNFGWCVNQSASTDSSTGSKPTNPTDPPTTEIKPTSPIDSSTESQSTTPMSYENCVTSNCTLGLEVVPVCASDGRTYKNPNYFNCTRRCGNPATRELDDWCPRVQPALGEDFQSCIRGCLTTGEYNPVCGSDRTVYWNSGRLNCQIKCGNAVEAVWPGQCSYRPRFAA